VKSAARPGGSATLGTALIAITLARCGGHEVTTPEPGPVRAASIEISPESALVDLLSSVQLAATVKAASGDTLAADSVVWSSTAPPVATVTGRGLVTGESAGIASIIASIDEVSDTVRVTVRRVVTSITISPTDSVMRGGDSLAMTATARDARGEAFTGIAFSWASSDVNAASVSQTGVVHAIGAGAATITASSDTLQATARVKVVGISPSKTRRYDQALWIGPNPAQWSDLYAPRAMWPTVQSRTHVVKLYVDDINEAAPDALQDVVRTLNAAHIAAAVEVGGLRDWDCDGGSLAAIEIAKLDKLVAAGAAVSFLAMDSPFGHTLATGGPGNCGYSLRQVAEQLSVYIGTVQGRYPHVVMGLIEPVPWYSVGQYPPNPGENFGDLPQLLDTLVTVLGEHGQAIEFFHADSPYDYDQAHPDGWHKLVALEGAVRSHGLRFGLIYNSDDGGNSGDQPFHDQTLAALQAFKDAGGHPDDLIVQSWYPFPSLMVPEDQPYTFTNVAKDFEALYDLLYP
jgi:hypothetical protein